MVAAILHFHKGPRIFGKSRDKMRRVFFHAHDVGNADADATEMVVALAVQPDASVVLAEGIAVSLNCDLVVAIVVGNRLDDPAVRKQAPVVVRNILHLIKGEAVEEAYDGYGACPLTTAYGKVLMAEFIYGGKPTPTLPLDPRKERNLNWVIKKYGLPRLYWDYMLKGYESFPAHDTNFIDPAS